jgi:hypothetical protein
MFARRVCPVNENVAANVDVARLLHAIVTVARSRCGESISAHVWPTAVTRVLLNVPEPPVVAAAEQEKRLIFMVSCCLVGRPFKPGLNVARPDCVVGEGPVHVWTEVAAPRGVTVHTVAITTALIRPKIRVARMTFPVVKQWCRTAMIPGLWRHGSGFCNDGLTRSTERPVRVHDALQRHQRCPIVLSATVRRLVWTEERHGGFH